ncbi:hypothetical protein LPJ61_001546 [Coemansia biformis]|uniref:Integrator complex subunit 6-like beta-barrel domain-containing protein n=1 Tax=Coemansia biformis TaxID=1286918 RepID=A0A9W7Y9U7_9FUNG|nr:hypothetical protein LPJ61_001546 [Coemansia biformis]
MIFVFLIDTSASMEQELNASLASGAVGRRDEPLPNERLFGGEKDRLNRRWQRKGAGAARLLHRNTRLDCAKSIIEQIVHNRQCFEHDRYMLATYGAAGRGCIRSGLKDSRAALLGEVQRLEATDRFRGDVSLAALFDQLALMRGAYDMDTYGFGRYPGLSEPVHIVWLTDGASAVTPQGVQEKLNLHVSPMPWVEAYREPFRWDQRMVLVLLHEKGDPRLCNGRRHSSEGALVPMCTVMGGTTHHVGSMYQAQRFVEALAPSRPTAGRGQSAIAGSAGVLVGFERIDDNPANPGNSDPCVLLHAAPSNIASGPLPPLAGGAGRAAPGSAPAAPGGHGNSAGMSALIGGHLGYFPIPEAFWPEAVGGSGWQLQQRSAHPVLGYSQSSTDWAVPPQFPFDKYQIDSNSNVAQKLLAAAAAAAAAATQGAQGSGKSAARPVCWPVFVSGSYTSPKSAGFPFGILRPNTARTAVNLFVLPYNFMALWKILGKLDAQAQAQGATRAAAAMAPGWRRELEEYLQHTPGYYAIPLKRAFNLYGIPHGVFPKTFGQSPGMRSITHYAQRINAIARREWDRVPRTAADAAGAATSPAMVLQNALLRVSPDADIACLTTNAFDVSRAQCLATLSAMRRVLVRELMAGGGGPDRSSLGPAADIASEDDRDSCHSVPIRDMGEYGAAMHRARAAEPRNPREDERVVQHQRRSMFGNPYTRPLREPRSPANNMLARSPELSAKLGLSRVARTSGASGGVGGGGGGGNSATTSTTGTGASTSTPPRSDTDDEAVGEEIESEAELNELAVGNIFDDMPAEEDRPHAGGKYWWMQRRNVPRRRSIATPWRKNDASWNVNPWAVAAADSALTFTADSAIVNTRTAQVITPAGTAVSATPSQAPTPPPASTPPQTFTPPVSTPPQTFAPPAPREASPAVAEVSGLGICTEAPAGPVLQEAGDGAPMDVDPATSDVRAAPPVAAAEPPAPATEGAAAASSPAQSPRPRVSVAEERAWFLKRIKADPAHYDEDAILRRVAELQGNPAVGAPQLKIIVGAAAAAARAMRRKQLVARLEQSADGAPC